MTSEPGEQSDELYEQQWQAQLADETKTWLALEERHRQEKTQSYCYEINLIERTALANRHDVERKTLLQQQRAKRIALRKSHPQ